MNPISRWLPTLPPGTYVTVVKVELELGMAPRHVLTAWMVEAEREQAISRGPRPGSWIVSEKAVGAQEIDATDGGGALRVSDSAASDFNRSTTS